MQGIRSGGEEAGDLTLGELVAAVLDEVDDEREVTPIVAAMLDRGSVRLRRRALLAPLP